MRDPATGADRFSIVCPPCFAELVEELGIGNDIDGRQRLVWCFRPHYGEGFLDVSGLWEDETGRVWDPEKCLWTERDG
jgi:hypothetical protein